jgi:hypothetical protein
MTQVRKQMGLSLSPVFYGGITTVTLSINQVDLIMRGRNAPHHLASVPYTSGKKVQEDWDSGKDFILNQFGHPDDGRFINKLDDQKRLAGATLNIRYKGLQNIKVIKV